MNDAVLTDAEAEIAWFLIRRLNLSLGDIGDNLGWVMGDTGWGKLAGELGFEPYEVDMYAQEFVRTKKNRRRFETMPIDQLAARVRRKLRLAIVRAGVVALKGRMPMLGR